MQCVGPFLSGFFSGPDVDAISKAFLAQCFQHDHPGEDDFDDDTGEDLCNCEFSLAYGGSHSPGAACALEFGACTAACRLLFMMCTGVWYRSTIVVQSEVVCRLLLMVCTIGCGAGCSCCGCTTTGMGQEMLLEQQQAARLPIQTDRVLCSLHLMVWLHSNGEGSENSASAVICCNASYTGRHRGSAACVTEAGQTVVDVGSVRF